MGAKFLLAIDALLGSIFLTFAWATFWQNADLAITALAKLASVVVTCIMIYKHREHGMDLLKMLYTIFQKKDK